MILPVSQPEMNVFLIFFHLPPAPLVGLNEQMKAIRKRNETSVIDQIGEDLLIWVRTLAISFKNFHRHLIRFKVKLLTFPSMQTHPLKIKRVQVCILSLLISAHSTAFSFLIKLR